MTHDQKRSRTESLRDAASGMRILLVEASPDDVRAFRTAFIRADVSSDIVACRSAEHALQRLREHDDQFDVMVTAQRLPGMTGLELCFELLRGVPPCGLVLLTRWGTEQVAVDALKAGVHEYLIKDPDGRYLRLLPAIVPQVRQRYRDGLARTQAERALRESEKRYQELYDHAPDMYFTVARDGTVLSANAFGAQELGYRHEELHGHPVWKVIHGADRARVQTQLEDTFRRGEGSTELTFRKVRKDGSILWVHERMRTVPDRRGGPPVIQILCRDVSERHRAEQAVLASREQLRALAARLHAVREEERAVIAREIHDELGQALTGVKMDLSWIADRLPAGDALRVRAEAAMGLVDDTLGAVRQLSARLRPAMLDDLGLEAAIEWQTQEFSERTGIPCQLDLSSDVEPVSPERATAVFRILQEALTNVTRHAEATQVGVTLVRADHALVLEVADDGKGIQDDRLTGFHSLGVLGMRERAGALGGWVEVASRTPAGTRVTLHLPIEARAGRLPATVSLAGNP